MINLKAFSLYSADLVPRNCVIWPKATPGRWVLMGSVRGGGGLWGLRAARGKSPPVFPPSPLPSFFCLPQEKNRTNVPGKAAPGSLLAPTNWRGITASTREWSRSSVQTVTAASPAQITWRSTAAGTCWFEKRYLFQPSLRAGSLNYPEWIQQGWVPPTPSTVLTGRAFPDVRNKK